MLEIDPKLSKEEKQLIRSNIIDRAGWYAIIANIVLFGLKYWAGIVTGSVAIIADAWHTLSDSITSIALVVGNKIAKKPADQEHPFGHGRVEIIVAIFIAVLLGIIAYSFFVDGINILTNKTSVSYGTLAIVVTVISIIAKEALARYAIAGYNKTKASSLRADAWHHRSDALSSVVILVGIFLGSFFWWIDGVLAIIVSVMIFYATSDILKESVSSILGERPDKATNEKLKEFCEHFSHNDINLHHLHMHKYGHHTEITFHIELPSDMSIKEAHDITDKMEDEIREHFDMEATIHIDPQETV